MLQFSFWDILSNLLIATQWTIVLSLIAFVCGGIVGLILLFMRTSQVATLEGFTKIYIEIFQGTPLLMQLFLFFFGIALLGVEVSPWMAATMALTFWTSAFLAEIWRGCIQGIPRAQWEAARIIGLNKFQQQVYVILPQALLISLPSTVGFFVQIIKATALLSVLGFSEILRTAQTINNATFQPFLIYGLCGLLYFILCWPLSRLSTYLEARFHVH